jgi:hypothetical protein
VDYGDIVLGDDNGGKDCICVAQIEHRIGTQALDHLSRLLKKERGLVNVTGFASSLQNPSDSQIQFWGLDVQLPVKDTIQLKIEVLARVHVGVPIAVLRLAAIQQSQELVHSNDVGPDSQKSY